MGHAKYVQCDMGWSRLTNWNWTKIDLENKMGGKLQKWICGHVQTFIQMFKWPCYKNGSDMQKKSHHHETQEFSLELKYKLCDYDYIRIMVWGSWQYCLWNNWSKSLD